MKTSIQDTTVLSKGKRFDSKDGSHDGPTRYLILIFQILLNLQNNPILGGMGRFLDDGNYAKDIVEGTMFKVHQI